MSTYNESGVFSFSAKGKDVSMVSDIKAKYRKQGKTFSWVVLDALKHYEASKEKANESNKSEG